MIGIDVRRPAHGNAGETRPRGAQTAGFGGTGVLMRCEFTDKQYPKITAVSAPSKPGCFGAAFPLDLAAAVLSVSVLSLHAFRVPAALGPLIVCLADRALLPVKLPV